VAGVFLLVALIGCAIVAGGMILYKRRRDASAPAQETQHTHIRLQI
jgi:ABC-type tungstate transport system substrate-binding protein